MAVRVFRCIVRGRFGPLDADTRAALVHDADAHDLKVEFFVDGRCTRVCTQAPDYPMQFMVAVFDFPRIAAHADHVPLFAIDRIRVTAESISIDGGFE